MHVCVSACVRVRFSKRPDLRVPVPPFASAFTTHTDNTAPDAPLIRRAANKRQNAV